ncbi:leucine-rich repeat, immunoglobulin-like domain and transmembrane domain-containing protein 3 [Tupaia chinensis]|uniref:leucine-rich repeat, immunoglobulin-like domain and transmembrane domain-containing protein 3 n=1 Tax=Tupaia chinensis TaxID=246437 RepID=UPI000FFC8D50|nr:leucine-rich repeat, immunoglobulin-like domain and transmembrane domain-containing protein 3 [Tupaia chinensis]
MRLLARLSITLGLLGAAGCSCPSQCTCDYAGSSDDTGSRSVLCSDLDMSEVPTNLPVDTVKLRIEKTVTRSIPAEAFYYLTELRSLWVAYNAVASVHPRGFYYLRRLHELRLGGNSLAAFPWASLLDTPLLRTLDLHNNRLASVPAEAVQYLRNLTYLDLSSNRLTSLPPDFLDGWPHLGPAPSQNLDLSPRRIVLGLQDNPWFCDCHMATVIELAKAADATVVLLDPLMACSEPEHLAGVLFQRAELEQCLKPTVMTSATQITSALGSNVLLRCDAQGLPTPRLAWARAGGQPVTHTAIQESPREGARWSVISLMNISLSDAGRYKCTAKNLVGKSEAEVTVAVVGGVTTAQPAEAPESAAGGAPEREAGAGSAGASTAPPAASPFTDAPSASAPPPTAAAAPLLPAPRSTLQPGRRYVACVRPQGEPPQRDQCVTFATRRAAGGGHSHGPLVAAVTCAACVAVLAPLGFLLYRARKLRCKRASFWEEDLAKETYIQFETLSPRSQSVGELWTRRHRGDSETLLLCSSSAELRQL